MLCGGVYLLLKSIHVDSNFYMGHRLFSTGNVTITSGYVLIPLMFGVGMLFYNAKNPIAWLLTLGSLAMLIFGVITSVNFRLKSMDAFELIVILVLMVGGLGLSLSGLRGERAD